MKTTKHISFLLSLGMVITTLPSCSRLLGAIEEEVEQRIGPTDEDGIRRAAPLDPSAVEQEGPKLAPRLKLNMVRPNRGSTIGDDLIEIVGVGFSYATETPPRVLLGPPSAAGTCKNVEVLSDTLLRCLTPTYPTATRVTIRVILETNDRPPETALIENGFEYFEPIKIEALSPIEAPTLGGTEVIIKGKGFMDATIVRFGPTEATSATLVNANTIITFSPPLERGVHSVTVSNLNGSDTMIDAFRVYEDVEIDQVAPVAGPLSGGTQVVVTGTGFTSNSNVLFGDNTIPAQFSGDGQSFSMETPSSNTEGLVELSINNRFGRDTERNAFAYVDTNNTSPRILAVIPAGGSPEGGTPVKLIVAGFETTNAYVTFNGLSAPCEPTENPHVLDCLAPESEPGAATISIQNNNNTAIRNDLFEYVDLRITSLSPDQGSIAGGTYVEIRGSGFDSDMKILFDHKDAKDVTVLSRSRLVLRTPQSVNEGPVTVSLQRLGLEHRLEDAYTYVDSFVENKLTTGGQINGSLNVTVTDTQGNRLANAYVMVGARVDPSRPYLAGYTNSRGQITLSGPDLAGPISVHAGKVAHGRFSLVDIDSQNVTMQLTPEPRPAPDPLPECPEPESAAPPILKGNVYRIKDRLNTGDDTVMVTTTYRNFSEPLPDPGPKSQLNSNGPYEMFGRTGDLSVIALAGKLSSEGIKVHAMGFHPFLYTEPSSGDPCFEPNDCSEGEQCTSIEGLQYCMKIYDKIDIVIDTPLDTPLEIRLDNPPLSGVAPGDGLPTHSSIQVWYDFGYMGLHPMAWVTEKGKDLLFVDMPLALPDALDFVTFNVDVGVAMSYQGNSYPPRSDTKNYGLIDPTLPVIATPFLPTHRKLSSSIQTSSSPINLQVELKPGSTSPVLPTANSHWLYNFEAFIPCEGAPPITRPTIHWLIISAGDNVLVDLPVFPQEAEELTLKSNTYYWQLLGLYSPSTSFEELNLYTLFGWKSRSLFLASFNYQSPN